MEDSSVQLDTQNTRSRRYMQPMQSQGVKPAGFWFKQRGYVDPVLDRRTATTTGHMLYQRINPRSTPVVIPDEPPATPPSPAVIAANRRRQTYNNHYSEHDNRNIIQNFGEYFGRGYGRRLVPKNDQKTADWMTSNYPMPVHPDRSVSQQDFCGWPSLGIPPMCTRSSTSLEFSTKSQKNQSSKHWMQSCYDDWGNENSQKPSRFVYRQDGRRLPRHPWQY